ncbi:MAG: FAD-binding oxidoreductase [Actinomycetota bacterium]|nr:FAD-binding oxidoreductase [Actinomycetota bacterium]
MTTAIALAGLEELQTAIRGDVIAPDGSGYEEARKVYNAMIDKRPALVVRCLDVADVQTALAFGRANGLDIAVRGAGHSAAGLGTVDDGLVIDLSPMRWTRVDPDARTVTAGGGCQLGDVDHATHAFGLTTPLGVVSTTGMGLVLGGGLGYQTRRYGLAIDNLLGADVVLADGSFVHASEDEHPDLFWALRGGGGNFGVVTAFTFRLHERTTVIAGPVLYPLEKAAEAMTFYRDFLAESSDDIYAVFAFLTVPPGPPFPEHLHLQKVCGCIWVFTGDPEDADEVLRPAREFGPPLLDGIMEMPLPALQTAFDALYPPGLYSYWKADFVSELPDDAIAAHVEHGTNLPTPLSTMHLYPIDRAAGRVAQDATAWSYRDAKWAEVIFAVDPDAANADLIRSWATAYWEAVHPYAASGGGAYVNFIQEESQDRVRASYRDNYDRLAQVKAKYDPGNVLHVNWNIEPAN